MSQIQSRFAVTLITSEVANLADSAKEIVFTAQLPDAAFISNFSMYAFANCNFLPDVKLFFIFREIGNKTIFGDVKEKEKAKEIYDKALRSGQSAGLVAEKYFAFFARFSLIRSFFSVTDPGKRICSKFLSMLPLMIKLFSI